MKWKILNYWNSRFDIITSFSVYSSFVCLFVCLFCSYVTASFQGDAGEGIPGPPGPPGPPGVVTVSVFGFINLIRFLLIAKNVWRFLRREHRTTKTKSGVILVFIHNSFDFGDNTICQVEKECSGTLCDLYIYIWECQAQARQLSH